MPWPKKDLDEPRKRFGGFGCENTLCYCWESNPYFSVFPRLVTVPTELSTTKSVYNLDSTICELKLFLLLLSRRSWNGTESVRVKDWVGLLHNVTDVGSMKVNFADKFPRHQPSATPFLDWSSTFTRRRGHCWVERHCRKSFLSLIALYCSRWLPQSNMAQVAGHFEGIWWRRRKQDFSRQKVCVM
jgi:hypothetical protein